MDQNETKPKAPMHDESKRMTPEEEFKIYLLHKEGKTNREIIEQCVREDGSKWSKSKIDKLCGRFNKNYIPSLSADKVEKTMDSLMGMGINFDESLKDFDAEKSMSRSFKMATRMLEQALKDAQAGYVIEDEMRRQVPIKIIMECIEKAGKFWTTYQKTRKESAQTGNMKIDYKEMAQIYMGAKQENIAYDAKGHMKAVIEEANRQTSNDEVLDEDKEF